MNTILVPLDGSTLAEQALPFARLYARLFEARLYLLNVVTETEEAAVAIEARTMSEDRGERTGVQYERIFHALAAQRRYAEEYMAERVAALSEEGYQVSFVVETGNPADVIIETARTNAVTMIIMATHGYSGLRRWTLGSVAEKVVQATPAPVLLLRSRAEQTTNPPKLHRILVPLDYSELSEQALPLAFDLAKRTEQAEVVLLHADMPLASIYPSPYLPSYEVEEMRRQDAMTELKRLATTNRTATVQTRVLACTGYPAESIIGEADERHADLIVMATHGWSGLKRWALGSVASKVMHASTTPLLLIRPHEGDDIV